MSAKGTVVRFFTGKDGNLTGFRSEGHTGYADEGADIVCAAVSALTQTALNGLKNVLGAPVMFEIDEGSALLEVRLTQEATPEQRKGALLLLRTLLEGLEAIEQEYPGFVHIILKERR